MTFPVDLLNWFKVFAKVFNPRVLLLIVANAAFFYGNIVASDYSVKINKPYHFDIIMYVWFGILALEILIITGIVGFDQILEAKKAASPKRGGRGSKGSNNGQTTSV